MNSFNVNLPNSSYKIDIGIDILSERLTEAVKNFRTDHVVVITNTTLQKFYPDLMVSILEESGVKVSICILPDGEKYKNLTTLSLIFDFLMNVNANRETLLIGFGGGVIGDMAGFAASIFLRGVRIIQVSTTLLSNVDSSVGGKTAVNHPLGKNSIGSFKQPEYVCIDLNFLRTLPLRELRSGYFELIKHGVIKDSNFFNSVINYSLEDLDFNFLSDAVFHSCKIKGKIVELDEKEKGLRSNLNFGHTLGHLIETHSGYGKYLHGEAVAAGMCFASFVSWRWKYLPKDEWEIIINSLGKLVEPIRLVKLNYKIFNDLILHDKKSQNNAINFIMLKKIGESFIGEGTSIDSLWFEFHEFSKNFPEIVKIE